VYLINLGYAVKASHKNITKKWAFFSGTSGIKVILISDIKINIFWNWTTISAVLSFS
jgi:hypothetical protein